MRSVPVVGCAVLLLLASLANRAGPGLAEPVQQEEVKQQAAADPDQMQQVIDRMGAIEFLVKKHTALVIDSLTDVSSPSSPELVSEVAEKTEEKPTPRDFGRVLKAADDGVQPVLYVYGSEGWEQVNDLLSSLTEAGIEHPHIVDLLECSPEEKEMAEAAKTEYTDLPWLQTIHSEDGEFGPIWYPLDRIDSTGTYQGWLRGNSETAVQGNWQENQAQRTYGYTYYPISYSSSCAT